MERRTESREEISRDTSKNPIQTPPSQKNNLDTSLKGREEEVIIQHTNENSPTNESIKPSEDANNEMIDNQNQRFINNSEGEDQFREGLGDNDTRSIRRDTKTQDETPLSETIIKDA